MDQDKENTFELLLAETVFSEKFGRRTAMFIIPPLTAGAIGFAGGCAGLAAYGNYVCDPLRHQRHDLHIEQGTSTGSLSAADVVMVSQWRST